MVNKITVVGGGHVGESASLMASHQASIGNILQAVIAHVRQPPDELHNGGVNGPDVMLATPDQQPEPTCSKRKVVIYRYRTESDWEQPVHAEAASMNHVSLKSRR